MSPAWAGSALLLVPLAGALGAVLRFCLDRALPRAGILTANLLASLTAGVVAGASLGLSEDPLPTALIALAAFVLALGTFSTLALRAAEHLLAGRPRAALGLWALHVLPGSVLAVVGGITGMVLGGILTGPASA